MYQANFGTNNPPQVQFNNENEYYQALGYLAKSDGSTSLHWENNENQGGWGSEGRIHFFVNSSVIPGYFKQTSGTGNIISRTNCNEFVENIVMNHNFIMGANQNFSNILTTIPSQYLNDFNYGLAL